MGNAGAEQCQGHIQRGQPPYTFVLRKPDVQSVLDISVLGQPRDTEDEGDVGGITPERVPRFGASAPIEHIELRSTDNGEIITVDGTDIGVQRSMTVNIEDCVVSEVTWNSGESMIYDQLSNGKCRDITVKFVNKFPYAYDVLPTSDAELNAWDDHWAEIGEVE